MKNILLSLAIASALFGIEPTFAASKKAPPIDTAAIGVGAPNQNSIWKYTYSPDIIFRVLTSPKHHTHLELGEDEGLTEAPVIGDSVQWRVSGGPRNLYIKPLRENLETTLTVVTNKRTYQFQLISAEHPDRLYQKISFDYPDRDSAIKLMKEARIASIKAEDDRKSQQILAKDIDPATLKFSYTITGDASFKPVTAYSDDKFTYLVMPDTQDMPGVFLVEDNGSLSLVKFRPRDSSNIIVIERVVKKVLLKLGSAEVYVTQAEQKKSWW